ncbi:hypothetical protein [Bacillus nitroreducens]
MELPIQGLIDFLMANAWLVIIIIGFILNTFRRFNSGESEPTTPVPMPKPFNPFDQDPKTEKDQHQVETKYENAELEQGEGTDSHLPNPFYDRFRELQEQGTYSETERKEEEPVLTVIKPTDSSERKAVKTFTKNKVVEGIIWSEILGPPRAKKPYQIRR